MNDSDCKLMDFNDIQNLVRSLAPEQRAQLIGEEMGALPVEEKVKVLQEQLDTTGLTVILGSNHVTTAEIAIQIHNAENLEIEKILGALASRIRHNNEEHL